jgi:hypothetical protein
MRKNSIRIQLGAIDIENWKPTSKKCFSYDFYYETDEYKNDVENCKPDEVVLKANKTYKLIISYPVSTPYTVDINTGKKGLTRIKVIDLICKHYRKMYAEEDGSSSMGDPGHIPGMLNRNISDGKYGIWGHDIGDLCLVNMYVNDNKKTIELGVDS